MTWWEWTLAGIGGYIALGFVGACVNAYHEGVDFGRNHPGQHAPEFDTEEAVAIAMVWPLYVVIVVIPAMFNSLYQYGTSHHARKLARETRRKQREELKALCRENGWNYRKMKVSPLGRQS